MIALLAGLWACQEPFGSDRHTLEDFRVAGLSLAVEGSELRADALLVVDSALWSDEPVDLAWVWLAPDADPNHWTGRADALGPHALLSAPTQPTTLLLVAVAPDGTERRAVLDYRPGARAEAVAPVDLAVLPWAVDTVRAEQLAIDRRLATEPLPDAALEPGGFLRLSESEPGFLPLRWMSTAGTFFELDPTRADWAAGKLILDDGEVVKADPLAAGAQPVVALRASPGAGSTWRVVDAVVGAVDPGAFVEGRWLPGAIDGWQSARLVADPDSTTGLRAVSATATSARPAGAACTELFSPEHLATGRCTRGDLEGQLLLFEAASRL